MFCEYRQGRGPDLPFLVGVCYQIYGLAKDIIVLVKYGTVQLNCYPNKSV